VSRTSVRTLGGSHADNGKEGKGLDHLLNDLTQTMAKLKRQRDGGIWRRGGERGRIEGQGGKLVVVLFYTEI